MPGYPTIQSAVMSAVAGDTINVCPGTYPEQVVVETPAKSNITLRSVVPLAARIQAHPGMEVVHGDLVRIDQGARNVAIRSFTIAGPLPDTLFCAPQLRSGVRVKGGASAVITNNHITEMRSANPLLRGCQNGFGVAVGRTFDAPVPMQVGQAILLGNRIDKYQKGGVYGDNAGTHVTLRENEIVGIGPTDVVAQNGVQISRRATADIRDNWVSDHAYFPPVLPCVPFATCVTATGILLFDLPGGVTVEENKLRRNQDGVVLSAASNLRVAYNTIIGGAPGFGSGIPGREWGDGIFADEDTAENQIIGNFLRDNIEHDCHDESVGPYNPPALVANPWIRNDGETENRPGLCDGARGDDDDDSEDDEDGSDDDSYDHGDHDSSDDSDDRDD
jgi:Right handed beta helix region